MNQYVTGEVIKEMRKQKNMTQLQLADHLGVTDKTVSKWENGTQERRELEKTADMLFSRNK